MSNSPTISPIVGDVVHKANIRESIEEFGDFILLERHAQDLREYCFISHVRSQAAGRINLLVCCRSRVD